jgi:dihydroorotase
MANQGYIEVPSMIDMHVHLRDWSQSGKETVKHGLEVAEQAGIVAVMEMPNTDPTLDSEETIVRRLKFADDIGSPVKHGIHMALRGDAEQVKRAIETYHKKVEQQLGLRNSLGVVGFKMYAGHSTGDIGVVREEDQQMIYRILAQEGYTGVLVVHCEKESCMDNSKFDPKNPITHATLARQPIAAITSLKDQLEFAKVAGYKGVLHDAHITTPEEVDMLYGTEGLRVSCGATWHNLVMNQEALSDKDHGLLRKMNPPLRPEEMRQGLVERLKSGRIPLIESDHAPHKFEEKVGYLYLPQKSKYPSGVPALHKWPKGVQWLRSEGFDETTIENVVFNAVNELYGLGLQMTRREVPLDLEREYPRLNAFVGTPLE